tara:strand:+ start:178 stop:402 length:225 start_codon:yes stop_codon:yes gene_type:complete
MIQVRFKYFPNFVNLSNESHKDMNADAPDTIEPFSNFTWNLLSALDFVNPGSTSMFWDKLKSIQDTFSLPFCLR